MVVIEIGSLFSAPELSQYGTISCTSMQIFSIVQPELPFRRYVKRRPVIRTSPLAEGVNRPNAGIWRKKGPTLGLSWQNSTIQQVADADESICRIPRSA
jgi:hypothetical protein